MSSKENYTTTSLSADGPVEVRLAHLFCATFIIIGFRPVRCMSWTSFLPFSEHKFFMKMSKTCQAEEVTKMGPPSQKEDSPMIGKVEVRTSIRQAYQVDSLQRLLSNDKSFLRRANTDDEPVFLTRGSDMSSYSDVNKHYASWCLKYYSRVKPIMRLTLEHVWMLPGLQHGRYYI